MIRIALSISIFATLVAGCATKPVAESGPPSDNSEEIKITRASEQQSIQHSTLGRVSQDADIDESELYNELFDDESSALNAGDNGTTKTVQKESSKPNKTTKKKRKPIVDYVVRDGESLWSIAARRSIYGDALLWPLLYQANRDQIKDPRQIFPGQTLSVPRNKSDRELDEAREKARESTIFPLDILLKGRE